MNPHYEGNPGTLMVADDRFISLTLDQWNFGQDNTGDLLKAENSQVLVTAVKEKFGHNLLLVSKYLYSIPESFNFIIYFYFRLLQMAVLTARKIQGNRKI
jgi:hypothetical protein